MIIIYTYILYINIYIYIQWSGCAKHLALSACHVYKPFSSLISLHLPLLHFCHTVSLYHTGLNLLQLDSDSVVFDRSTIADQSQLSHIEIYISIQIN